MPSWLTRFLTSSIGKKVSMALSGLALVGFLVAHLAGNLTLWADADGAAFNAYAAKLESWGPLLTVAELGLLALVVVHVGLALKVSRDNRAAREARYHVRSSLGASTAGSSSMLVTGLVVGVFLVVHVADFRVPRLMGAEELEDLAAAVKRRLSSPLGAGIYVVGVAALGLHLSHAFASAFQTLGLNHPRYRPWIRWAGLGLAVVLFLGFLSFPVVLFATGMSES